MKIHFIVSVLIFATATGCSTQNSYDPVQAESKKREILDIRNETLKNNLETVPSWVLAPPKPDGISFYAVGIGSSNDLNVAMKKSTLNAEFTLAKMYSQELSGTEKNYSRDRLGDSLESYSEVVYKIVRRVPVVGYSIDKQEIVISNGKYNSYVLLRMPNEQFSKLLQQQKEREASAEISKAFEDLDSRLKSLPVLPPTAGDQPSPDTVVLSQGL